MASTFQVDNLVNAADNGPVNLPFGANSIAVHGGNTAGTSIASATETAIPFVADLDTNSAWSSTKFTAPASGAYRVNATLCFASFSGSGSVLIVKIRKNGSSELSVLQEFIPSATSFQWTVEIEDIVSLAAADYIEITLSQSSGSTQALSTSAGFNYIGINKV